MLGLDPLKDLSSVRAAALTEFINQRLKEAWEFDFWRELMRVELRQYRDTYASGTAYTAAAEVFFLPTQQYYQALQSTTGNDPATVVNGAYAENSQYWAVSTRTYGGTPWAASTPYLVGQQIFDVLTQASYQCLTVHTSGSSIDYTKFGRLTPFNPYIAYDQSGCTAIGTVKRLTRRNPQTFTRNEWPVPFTVSANGIQVDYTAPTQVWVEFRVLPNVFTSVPWGTTTAYTANQLVYDSLVSGECYVALQGGTNQAPASSPAYWQKLDFPRMFASFVKRMVKADGLREMKQTNRANIEEDLARQELSDAVDREMTEQGQYATAGVATYGTRGRRHYERNTD